MGIEISPQWREWIRTYFPNLLEGVTLEFTSPADPNYNCLSWAVGITHPALENAKGAFWPWKHIPDDTADGWAQVCEKHGYKRTDNASFVPGIEKVAILGNGDLLHATRQGENGMWKSKLGDLGPDIDHEGLDCLTHIYGKVEIILERIRYVKTS